jgi:GT2 family glycosyltransferase
MSDASVAVIIATTSRDSLRRAVQSVVDQTHKNTVAVVVIDGPDFALDGLEILSEYSRNPRVQWVTLPQNTGSGGYVCHRIYGAIPYLVNQDYVCFLDDDNWLDPEHVAHCVEACEVNALDWCFTLREIWDDDRHICTDLCESVGMWPTWHIPGTKHIDTNCYFFRRGVAVGLSMHWHKSRFENGKLQESPDTTICQILHDEEPKFAMVPIASVNYQLGSSPISPPAEFFLKGNPKFLERHGGTLPFTVVK